MADEREIEAQKAQAQMGLIGSRLPGIQSRFSQPLQTRTISLDQFKVEQKQQQFQQKREDDKEEAEMNRKVSFIGNLDKGTPMYDAAVNDFVVNHYDGEGLPGGMTPEQKTEIMRLIGSDLKAISDAKTREEKQVARQNAARNFVDYRQGAGSGTLRNIEAAETALKSPAFAAQDPSNQLVPPEVARLIGIPEGANLTIGQANTLGFDVPTDGTESALENKKRLIMEANPNLSNQDATGFATGTTKVVSDEVSGTRFLVDTISGTERPLVSSEVIPEVEKPLPPAAKGQTLWQMAGKATGPGSAGLSAVSVLSGQFGGPIAQETVEARQFMTSSQNDLVRSLALNSKFPVMETKRLMKEVNISPKILDNEPLLQARMKSVDRFLRERLAKEQKSSSNPNLPVAERRNARQSIAHIEHYLNILGVPKAGEAFETFNMPDGSVQTFDINGKRVQ